MLTIIESGFCTLGESELITQIKLAVEKKQKAFLFVPEQQTLSRERAMCDILPPSSALCFEVTNFSRFTNTAFRSLGGISGEYSDKATDALIMWRALTELAPVLKITGGKSTVTSGTVSRALSAVREMQGLAITPMDLSEAEAACGTDKGKLKEKLADLSLIFSLYEKLLLEKYSDIYTDTVSLAKMLAERPDYLSGAEIYIDGFTSFTEPQYRLISEFIKSASVTVRLIMPRHGLDGFEYSELKSTRRRLITLADKCGAQKRILHPESPDGTRPEIIRAITELLWKNTGTLDDDTLKTLGESGGRVRIFSAETPFAECDFVASDIKRRVMAGAKYSDFAVIARGADAYLGILDLSLDSADIPYFYSKKKDLSSFEAIKLINTAYAIISRGFAREDVLTYLKCGLSGITRDEGDIFEEYVDRWGIDGRRFLDPEAFTMNPRGYEPFCEDDVLLLEKIADIRERLITPLADLSDKAKSAHTVREHATVLYEFLCELDFERALYERALELRGLYEDARAEENLRLYKTVCDSLDRLVTVLGDTRADSECFINQLGVVLGEFGMSSIPAHIDEVTVGSADMIRLSEKKHVYLIGVNDGEFPRTVSDDSYFTDRDKAALMDSGLAIEPDLDIRGARELYAFSRAFSSAGETVTLLYSRRSPDLAPILPASPIERIKDLTRGTVLPIDIDTLRVSDRLFTTDMAYELYESATQSEREQIRLALMGAGDDKRAALSELPIENGELTLGGEVVAMLYGGDLYLSQSRIESYMRCPFSYFLRYNLKLGESERAELSSNVIGSFIHAILEDFFCEVRERGLDVAALTDEEKLKITERASKRYVSGFLGGGGKERTKVAIARLCRSALPVIDGVCDEFSDCKFVPAFFELSTDGRRKNDARPIVYTREDGKKIIIRGKVDRVDTYKNGEDVYVRVVDYKTGSKEFSPSDMAEGINMQMFLYLESIVRTDTREFRERIGVGDGGELIPAGVIYAKTSIKDAVVKTASDGAARQSARELSSREGMVLDEECSLSAMNPRYTPLSYPETPRNEKANARRKYTREDWEEICKSMESAILDVTAKMQGGNINASPTEIKGVSPCDRCKYRAVCRKKEI